MKESLKKNWKPITAIALAFCAVGAAAYYVNCVYIPGKEQERAAALAATELRIPQKETPQYTIDTSNPQTTTTVLGSGTNSADDNIKVTTDADGNVTIDRNWDGVNLDELDTSTAAPGAPTANIGSGGGKITGTDGAYHGEQPTTPAPSTGGSDRTTTTKPSTGDSASKPSTDTEKKPSTGTTTKPATPSTGDTTTKPSGGSGSGGSTPQMGDIRVVDGKEQMWIEGFGWTEDGGGGHTDYLKDPGDCGGIDGFGEQVGEMG